MYFVIVPEDKTTFESDSIVPEMIEKCRQKIAGKLFPQCRAIIDLDKQYPDSPGYRLRVEFRTTCSDVDGRIRFAQSSKSLYLSDDGLLLGGEYEPVDWMMISHECHLLTQQVRKVVEAKLLELLKRGKR